MSFEISISEFNQQFQLYQKGDRYNLNIYNLDMNHFIVTFFNETIEDLEIAYASKEDEHQIFEKKVSSITFNHFFEKVENLIEHHVYLINGFYPELDFYFNAVTDFIEINYISRDLLFEIIDRILNGMDCNYKSRLKTELLINMEFD